MLLLQDVLPELTRLYGARDGNAPPSASQELMDAALSDFEEYTRRLNTLRDSLEGSLKAQEESRRETLSTLQQRLMEEEESLRTEVDNRKAKALAELSELPSDAAPDLPTEGLTGDGNRLVDFWKRKNQYLSTEVLTVTRRREAVESRLESFRYGQHAQISNMTRAIAQLQERIAVIRHQCEQYRKLAQSPNAKSQATGSVEDGESHSRGESLVVLTDDEKAVAAEEEESLKRCIHTFTLEVEVNEKLAAAESRRVVTLRNRIAEQDFSSDNTAAVLEHAYRLRSQLKELVDSEAQNQPQQLNVYSEEESSLVAASKKALADSVAEEEELERQVREKRVEIIRLLNRSGDEKNMQRVRSLQEAQLLKQQIAEVECEKMRVLKDIDELTTRAKYDTIILSKYRQ